MASKVTHKVLTAGEKANKGHRVVVGLAAQAEKNLTALAIALAEMKKDDLWKLVTVEGKKFRTFRAYLAAVTGDAPLISSAISSTKFAEALLAAGVESVRDVEALTGVSKSAVQRMAAALRGEKAPAAKKKVTPEKVTITGVDAVALAITNLGPLRDLSDEKFAALASVLQTVAVEAKRRRDAKAKATAA